MGLCSRVYRLEIQSVMLVFSTQPCELLPLSLLTGSTPPPTPLSCVNKYVVYTYCVQCVRGGGFLGLRQINTFHKVPLQVNIFR
jgi:hypothetical protein